MNERRLPLDLLFEDDGHVTEVCLTAVADGEIAIVAQVALDHIDTCEACGARLGEAALLAATTHEAMLEAPRATANGALTTRALADPPSNASRRPFPFAAIAIGLFVAAITSGPAISDGIA